MPKVSVIIPVYNTAPYLRRCLDSVCGQTLRDIEIICVDDGSTDGSAKILLEYAEKDGRVSILTQPENRGPGAARNAGLDVATGLYVGFVDSDDYPEKDFYALLLGAAECSCADIAKGCYRDSETHAIAVERNLKVREDKTNLSFEFCSCLFRRGLLEAHGIRFPAHLRDMEDPIFSFTAALHCNAVVCVDKAHINIFHHATSSTGKVPDFTRVRHKCLGLTAMQELANKASMTPQSYGYVMATWCLVTLFNASRNRELRAREYLGGTVKRFIDGLRHKDAFVCAADAMCQGAGSYLTSCKIEDIPYFTEDISRWHLERENSFIKKRLREFEHKNKQLALQVARLSLQRRREHAHT